jgi:hypothetical protein
MFAGKWMELENFVLSKATLKSLHVFFHMLKLDLCQKYTYIYYFYIVRENKIILVSPSEGAMGGGRDRNDPSLCEYNIMYCAVEY